MMTGSNGNLDNFEDRRNRSRRDVRRPIRQQSSRTLPSLLECPLDQTPETEKDSLNESAIEHGVPSILPSAAKSYHKMRPNKKLLGLLSYDRSRIFGHDSPFYHFWINLSTLYGITLLVIMFTICIIEVMDNPIKLFSIQGIFLIYLHVGSIAVIICIYIWVLMDSCSSIRSINSDTSDSGENTDFSHFGSLKRAHISRTQTSNTSFYLRIGALLFGLGTLVFHGLEISMHSMMEVSCLNDIVFLHPILNALFTFLQMHFLFVNSQVLVEKFGLVARFGFIHLAATNIALWIRLVIWETALEWIYFVYLAQNSIISGRINSDNYESDIPTPLQLRGYPRFISHQEKIVVDGYNSSETSESCMGNEYKMISENHMKQVISLHSCMNTNSLGQLWTSSMPFLYPFTIQFCLIAAGVTYIMSRNVGMEKICKRRQSFSNVKFTNDTDDAGKKKIKANGYDKSDSYVPNERIDCNGISKGLFLGLLCMVVVIVITIIFIVVKDDDDFPPHALFWLTNSSLFVILSLSATLNCVGLFQIRKLSYTGRKMSNLDSLLNTVSIIGTLLYAIFGIVVGASGVLVLELNESDRRSHLMLSSVSILQIVQSSIQSIFVGETLQRGCVSRHHQLIKPGRQVVTFLLCGNIALWAFDSLVTQSWLSQELQLRFCGLLLWGIISRISLPLLVFYRFHSSILLLEIWHRCYTVTTHVDPFN